MDDRNLDKGSSSGSSSGSEESGSEDSSPSPSETERIQATFIANCNEKRALQQRRTEELLSMFGMPSKASSPFSRIVRTNKRTAAAEEVDRPSLSRGEDRPLKRCAPGSTGLGSQDGHVSVSPSNTDTVVPPCPNLLHLHRSSQSFQMLVSNNIQSGLRIKGCFNKDKDDEDDDEDDEDNDEDDNKDDLVDVVWYGGVVVNVHRPPTLPYKNNGASSFVPVKVMVVYDDGEEVTYEDFPSKDLVVDDTDNRVHDAHPEVCKLFQCGCNECNDELEEGEGGSVEMGELPGIAREIIVDSIRSPEKLYRVARSPLMTLVRNGILTNHGVDIDDVKYSNACVKIEEMIELSLYSWAGSLLDTTDKLKRARALVSELEAEISILRDRDQSALARVAELTDDATTQVAQYAIRVEEEAAAKVEAAEATSAELKKENDMLKVTLDSEKAVGRLLLITNTNLKEKIRELSQHQCIPSDGSLFKRNLRRDDSSSDDDSVDPEVAERIQQRQLKKKEETAAELHSLMESLNLTREVEVTRLEKVIESLQESSKIGVDLASKFATSDKALRILLETIHSVSYDRNDSSIGFFPAEILPLPDDENCHEGKLFYCISEGGATVALDHNTHVCLGNFDMDFGKNEVITKLSLSEEYIIGGIWLGRNEEGTNERHNVILFVRCDDGSMPETTQESRDFRSEFRDKFDGCDGFDRVIY